jgi:hypothetical protein
MISGAAALRVGEHKRPRPQHRWFAAIPLCLLALVTLAATAGAQQPAAPAQPAATTNDTIDWPSPDGAFAFRTSYADTPHSIDLIDKASAKTLQRIDEEDSSQATWHVLWAPNSKRFALMTRLGHPIQGVDVYFRSGSSFEKVDLPDLPEANIPEKLKHGRKFPHIASQNWQEATRWRKDGALVVTVDTMIDGDGATLSATRTVVLGFDPAGKAKVLTSTIKYGTGPQ